MSLRKDRIHQCGLSNIDFRSKGDIENLNFFEPWKTYTNHFGTMGNKNYVRSYSSKKSPQKLDFTMPMIVCFCHSRESYGSNKYFAISLSIHLTS